MIDQYELLSDETLDDLIGDLSHSSMPLDESFSPGRVSFASQYPYLDGVHYLRVSIDQFVKSLSWAFIGIISHEVRLDNSRNAAYSSRSSFGWHLGRQSIIYDRLTSIDHHFDGRDISQGDVLRIKIDCSKKIIVLKNERTSYSHSIEIDTNSCPLPWFFAVNFNYEKKDFIRLKPLSDFDF